jgi:CheY-like chemotaxis protein
MTKRILVVDDEEVIREIVSSYLGSGGYQYRQAGSGNEALAVHKSGERFDLILTGVMMADLDGIALLERVNVEYPGIPVVFLTAVYDAGVALECFRRGAYVRAWHGQRVDAAESAKGTIPGSDGTQRETRQPQADRTDAWPSCRN